MNAPARNFVAKEAKRERVPVLVGLMGPSGSGKTFSALRLATGIQAVAGGDVYVIDTEARRALHYAEHFKFKHVQFDAPFGSLDYLSALQQCVKAGAGVVVVDSMSHEHEGPGGMLDLHEQELDRLAGDDWAKRERMKMLAWQKPKAARRQLINGLLQLNANFVFCFRAKETVKPMKINGKTEIVPQGFMPIAGPEFIFEMTTCCLLMPAAKGVPTWLSENVGERQMIKSAAQFAKIFEAQKPLDETIGRALAEWARGSVPARVHDAPKAAPSEKAEVGPPTSGGAAANSMTTDEADAKLAAAAEKGTKALSAAWKELKGTGHQKSLKAALDRRHKINAMKADAAAT